MISENMAKGQSRDIMKKPRPGQIGTLIAVRLQPDALARLDRWIAKQPGPAMSPAQPGRALSRPEAIRALMDAALEKK
jgi:cytochrome c553